MESDKKNEATIKPMPEGALCCGLAMPIQTSKTIRLKCKDDIWESFN